MDSHLFLELTGCFAPQLEAFYKEIQMVIRKIERTDLDRVNSICISAFMGSVAPSLTEEGIETFKNIASVDGFISRMKADNEMLAYEEKGEVLGMIEFKEGRHISMLFVSPCSQKKGVGGSLVSSVLPYTRGNLMTVRASLTSVPAYMSYGFKCTDEIGESSGLTYQPMVMEISK